MNANKEVGAAVAAVASRPVTIKIAIKVELMDGTIIDEADSITVDVDPSINYKQIAGQVIMDFRRAGGFIKETADNDAPLTFTPMTAIKHITPVFPRVITMSLMPNGKLIV